MKKLFSVLFSAALVVLVSTAGIGKGFAAEVSEDYSVESLSYIEQSEDDYAQKIDADVSVNHPEITGFAAVKGGVTVSWTQYPGAAKYRLFVYNGSGWKSLADSTTLSCTHYSPINGTTYLYTVRAMDSNNNYISSYFKQGYTNTYYAPPVISSLTNTNDGVEIKWDKNSGIASYSVYRKTKSTKWTKIGNANSTSYVDKNVASGIAYTYTVRCLDSNGKTVSYYNAGKNITYVKSPSISKIENTATGAKITWSACAGASKYRVYYLNSNKKWIALGTTTSTNFTHNNLKNGTTYTYTVRCLDSKGNYASGYDKTGANNIFIAPPVISSLTNTNDGVEIKWGKNSGIASYSVYRKTKSTKWTKIGNASSTSYVDKNVASGTAYTYTVRCLDSNGKTVSYYNAGKSITYVKSPSISKIENTATGAKITWSACAGASKYRVYYLNSNKKWIALGTTTSTNFTHNNLKNGTTYTYTVRCLDSKGNYASGYDKTGANNTFIAPPVISSLTSIYGGVEIQWGNISGAKSYSVYRKTKSTKWTKIGNASSTSYVDKNVASGTAYTYTVRCLDSNGKTVSYYNAGKSITYVKSPSISKIENTATGAKITWSACAGASKYRVYYLNSNKKWIALGTTTLTNFTHNNLKNGTTYTYTVRCLDSKGNYASGYNKSGTSNLFLAPPAISSVTKTSKGNQINWNYVTGAAGYRLYRKTINTKWTKLTDTTKNSYVDTSAKSGVVYTYTLRCLDKNGNLISYYISNTKYYYNGAPANGNITVNGETYYFSNGLFRSGYQTINGKKYYFNSNGVIQKNGIVGSSKEGWYYADSNGVCCESEEMRLAAEYMMKYCTGDTLDEKMKSGFLYMAKNFPYNRTYDHPKSAADIAPLAIDMFTNQRGNCFRYAACFACVAKIAGYRTRVVIGTAGGNPHGWTEVLVDGEWLICDPDAQIPGYNVPDYKPYMMKKHYWDLVANVKCELVIENGKAVWK